MSDENDFGFTAVDEEELGGLVAPPPAPQATTAPTDFSPITAKLAELQAAVALLKPPPTAQLTRMEEKIDRVLRWKSALPQRETSARLNYWKWSG